MGFALRAQEPLFKYRTEEPRWSSPENLNGVKGNGGRENFGGKGHPNDSIAAGKTLTLLDVKGTGEIRRIWITINKRSPEMLRLLRVEMFWDGEAKPAVSVPFGDFFGLTLAKMTDYENALFSTAEGRSFNCFVPMPFRSGARIQIVNGSDSLLDLIYFDVDYVQLPSWDPANLYFHAYWHRDTATTLGRDFELLPRVTGKGRLLGFSIGVNANPKYGNTWFGEGEVKVYLDGDKDLPTLVGTGTEDYIGSGWGQKRFINRYTGCTVSGDTPKQSSFYRLHIPDPIYFSQDCRATLQQIGGAHAKRVAQFQAAGVAMIPVTYGSDRLYHPGKPPAIIDANKAEDPWVNFYRSDDVCAITYFYLDQPGGITQLPEVRDYDLSYGSFPSSKLDLYLPANRNAQTPFVILIHGGAWITSDKKYERGAQQMLLEQGIASVNINYRFVDSLNTHYEALLADIDSAVRYCIAHADSWHTRKSNFVFMGTSAGAHLALLYPYLNGRGAKAIIAQCAPVDLSDTSALRFATRLGLLPVIFKMTGATWKPGQAIDPRFRASSPLFHVKNIPTLIIHGTNDRTVPFSQAVRLHEKLDALKIKNKLIPITGADHDLNMRDPATRAMIHKEICDWIWNYN